MAVKGRGGNRGAFWLAAVPGDALVKITGAQDATYEPGQNFVDGHGMDDRHGTKIPVHSTPSITLNRLWNPGQAELWKAMRRSEQNLPSEFEFYPLGESLEDESEDHGIAGTCFIQTNSAQGLTDAIKNAVTVHPAEGDWVAFGGWEPA